MQGSCARRERRFVQRWLEAGFDVLFPPRCVGCGAKGTDWCSDCDRSLSRLKGRLCPGCGRALGSRGTCPDCEYRPLPLVVRSCARYDGPLVRAVLHLKYRPNPRLAAVMAGWLAEIYRREGWQATLVVPVPLGRERLRQRGYNQAGLVASELAKALGLPAEPEGLKRARETRSQVGLDTLARLRNVEDAFQAHPPAVAGHTVLLVDDLYTTGATLSSCAQALISGGAHQVLGLTVGRAR